MSLDLPLIHLFRPADPTVAEPWLLVLLHGVGSHERDLHGLAAAVPAQFHVLSLRAPLQLGPDAFGWFTFVVNPDGSRVIDTAQEARSRPLVARTVRSAAGQLGIPAERVVVGGFSQGGIMSVSLLLTEPTLLTAAMVMHGRLLPEILPLAAPPAGLSGRRLWVSHGTEDQMIPVAAGRDISDRLQDMPIDITYTEFPGVHELRPAEVAAVMSWLADLSRVRSADE